MTVLLSKGAFALFAFTAFAPSATGPLVASAFDSDSEIDIESERQLRLRGQEQEVKDSIQVDSVRRLGSLCLDNQERLEVNCKF